MKALTHFNQLDNSTRTNIVLNYSELTECFADEDMKAITYPMLKKYEKTSYYVSVVGNCNLFLMDDAKETTYIRLITSINDYKPEYVCSINSSERLDTILSFLKYKFMHKQSKLYIYKRIH